MSIPDSKKNFREDVTKQIISLVESGTAPWMKPWNPQIATQILEFPYNAATSRPYRGANALHLMAKAHIFDSQDPRWMTYNQAQAQGWKVRHGEKGTGVEYWKFMDDIDVTNEETGEETKLTVKRKTPSVFYATVFHASQIDGISPYVPKQRSTVWNPVEQAEDIIQGSGATIYHDQQDRAFYSPSKDDIHLPPREAFSDSSNYYEIALHELSHWTGHESRLKRNLSGAFGSQLYAQEELRAEIASLYIAMETGIPFTPGKHGDMNLDNYAAYIKSWIDVLKNDKNEIFRAAKDAETISNYITGLTVVKDKMQETTSNYSDITLTQFTQSVMVEKADKYERLWQISAHGEIIGCAEADTEVQAIREVHKRLVNNALCDYTNTDSGPRWDGYTKKAFPSEDVLQDYPELKEKFGNLFKAAVPTVSKDRIMKTPPQSRTGTIDKTIIEMAANVNLPQFLIARGEPIKRTGKYWRHKTHDSLVFKDNCYFWNSQGKNGNAINFMRDYYGLTFQEAVRELTGIRTNDLQQAPIASKQSKDGSVQSLPEYVPVMENSDQRRTIAYLVQTRNISYETVKMCLDKKILTQDELGNAVFLMRDRAGKEVGAEIVGTTPTRFKKILEGSKDGYGFHIVIGNPEKLYVTESAIDALSYFDLHKTSLNDCVLLSMGGLKENTIKTMAKLYHVLYENVISCHDNDQAGQNFLEKMTSTYMIQSHQPPEGKDWNEYLQHNCNDKRNHGSFAKLLLQKNQEPQEIVTILRQSPDCPARTDEARKWANKIVRTAQNELKQKSQSATL